MRLAAVLSLSCCAAICSCLSQGDINVVWEGSIDFRDGSGPRSLSVVQDGWKCRIESGADRETIREVKAECTSVRRESLPHGEPYVLISTREAGDDRVWLLTSEPSSRVIIDLFSRSKIDLSNRVESAGRLALLDLTRRDIENF